MPPPLRSSSSSTTSAAAPPTGRVELLSWINAVCGSRYPCIESLRDGVAYLSLVEAALSRGASLSKSNNNNNNEVGDGVLSGASQLLNKADIDVTALVVASSSSSSSSTSAGATVSDSIQVRERCERNFHLLQEMLRKYVPRDGSVEVDVKRLAGGKLQDHLRLLQWCVKFVSRQLTPKPAVASSSSSATPNKTRSRSAGVTNHRDPQHAPQDDADRNNNKSSGRTFQRNASTPAAATAAQPKKGGDVATAQARGFGSRGQQQQQVVRSQSAHGVSSSSSSSPGGVGSASTAVGEVQYDPLRYKSNTTPSSKPPPPGTSNTSALGEGAVVDTELEKLLNEVESLEREAWAAGGPQTGDDGNGDVTSFSSPLTKNSLSTVRELLHERDVLWQTLVAIEATVWTAAQRQQQQGQYSFEEEGPSPQRPSSQLLKDLCAVFNVDLPE